MNDSLAPLPCPFCGEKGAVYGPEHPAEPSEDWRVGCTTFGCRGQWKDYAPVFLTRDEAIEAWNRRLSSPEGSDTKATEKGPALDIGWHQTAQDSLLEHHDMYRFYTPKFMAAVARFGRSCGQFMERFSTYQTDEITAEMLTAVTEMQEGLQDAALSGPVRFQMDQLKKTLEGNGMFDNMTEREIFQQAKLFHDSLLIELSSQGNANETR